MQFEKEINIYSDEAIIKQFKAVNTSISVTNGKLSAIITESELVELQNSSATMYSRLASAVMEIGGLTADFSELESKYNTVTGQYTELSSKVAQYKAGVDGLSGNITEVTKNLKNNYSTTTAMNTAINASAKEISGQISAVQTTLKNDYSTTAAMNSAIKAKVNELSLSVSSSYSKKSELTAAENRIGSLESWKKEAQLKITDSAIVSTVTSSSAYKTSVDSLIEQKANSIRLKAERISWESTYSSMTSSGTLTCQNATIKGTLYSENGNEKVYLRNGRMQIWYNDVELGLIGGNGFAGYGDKEGLNFDLENSGDYMTWAAQEVSGGNYMTKWTYARESFSSYSGDMLNAGCDIDMHNYNIRNAWLNNIVAPNGYKGWTGEIPIITKIEDIGNGRMRWWTSSITVSNGIITSAPRA